MSVIIPALKKTSPSFSFTIFYCLLATPPTASNGQEKKVNKMLS